VGSAAVAAVQTAIPAHGYKLQLANVTLEGELSRLIKTGMIEAASSPQLQSLWRWNNYQLPRVICHDYHELREVPWSIEISRVETIRCPLGTVWCGTTPQGGCR
jgi:hypothetical protein